VCLTVDR